MLRKAFTLGGASLGVTSQLGQLSRITNALSLILVQFGFLDLTFNLLGINQRTAFDLFDCHFSQGIPVTLVGHTVFTGLFRKSRTFIQEGLRWTCGVQYVRTVLLLRSRPRQVLPQRSILVEVDTKFIDLLNGDAEFLREVLISDRTGQPGDATRIAESLCT